MIIIRQITKLENLKGNTRVHGMQKSNQIYVVTQHYKVYTAKQNHDNGWFRSCKVGQLISTHHIDSAITFYQPSFHLLPPVQSNLSLDNFSQRHRF